MSSYRLAVLCQHSRKIQHLLQHKSAIQSLTVRCPVNVTSTTSRCQKHCLHTSSMWRRQSREIIEEDDAPVKYSTSGAHHYKSIQSFSIDTSHRPWYQPWSLWVSMAVFMIYFFILREENDIDDELGKSLFERLPGFEEQHLQGRILYFKRQGMDTSELQKRLFEVQTERVQAEEALAERQRAEKALQE